MRKTVLVDDISGEEGAATMSFALDGRYYEVDLIAKNRARFDKAIEPFLTAGRAVAPPPAARPAPLTPRRRRAASQQVNGDGVDPAAVRTWAAVNGITVASRGRIPADLLAAYRAAQ